MRQIVRKGLAASLIIGALILGSNARSEVPPSGLANINAAYARFEALAQQKRNAGDLPRLSDPSEAATLKLLWDVPNILGEAPYTAKDVPILLEILKRSGQAYKTYALFTTEPETLPDTVRSAYTFQNEIVQNAAFLVKTIVATTEAVADFVAHLKPEEMNDVRRNGLRRMRLGFTEMVSGYALMLRSPGLGEANQLILVESLAETAPTLAKALPARDRAALGAIAETTLPSLPLQARPRMTSFAEAMRSAACEGLCRIE